MVQKLQSRQIKPDVEKRLWALAAGRCEFNGCNRPVFKSPVTEEYVNISEKAHIYAFSEKGPRGHGPLKISQLNDISNLMLVCHDCHKTIDQDKQGIRYSAKLLKTWKQGHEKRIAIVTGVSPTKKSHVILYAANIADQSSNLQPAAANNALFPDWYPAEEHPILITMKWEGRDSDPSYWKRELDNLSKGFARKAGPLLEGPECPHFSLFALAPMPLMIQLGVLITDKIPAQTYQLHREPAQSWKWQKGPKNFNFMINRPSSQKHPPALVLSLSDYIASSRIEAVMGKAISIWELTIKKPNNDFLKSKEQLSLFRRTIRELLDEIGKAHGKQTPISIFPAMPVACAVELGRIRMPKADSRWITYDYINNKFFRALEIGATK